MGKHETREAWLKAATALLEKEFFSDTKHSLPAKLQVSCGIPYGSAKAIGQYWPPTSSQDETTNIFICPSLSEPIAVLATHLHELIHAVAGPEAKHGGLFKKLARDVGLAGKLTATYAEEGSELWLKLAAMSTTLGNYPHSPIRKRKPKQKAAVGGWVRLKSTEDEKYKVLISPKMLEEFGVPTDPWGNEMVPVETAE